MKDEQPESELEAAATVRPCHSGEHNTTFGDRTPCRMTEVTLHSHVHSKDFQARSYRGGHPQDPQLREARKLEKNRQDLRAAVD